jgi:hypothetical protein
LSWCSLQSLLRFWSFAKRDMLVGGLACRGIGSIFSRRVEFDITGGRMKKGGSVEDFSAFFVNSCL